MAFRRPAGKTPTAPTLSPEQERAWRSVQKFNQMTSTLTSVARALTGNKKLVVRAGKVTQTDGVNTVTIRPPISLGDKQIHDREFCNERDENRSLICMACRTSEETWRSLQHELAHILGDSLSIGPNRATRDLFNEMVNEWHPSGACNHASRIISEGRPATNYISLMDAFDPIMSLLFQAVEDARVDSKLFKAKPGLRKAFQSFVYRTFENGVEQPDGSYIPWNKSLPNSQFAVGLVIRGEGFKVQEHWFLEPIYNLLHDEVISKLIESASSWVDVHDAAKMTMLIVRRLNELGYPMVPQCEIPPPPPPAPPMPSEDESDPDDDDSEESDKSGDNNFNNEGKSDDKSDADSQGEREPSSDNEAGEDSSDADPDDSDSSDDRGDGLGDGDDDSSPDGEAGSNQQDATGDGTPGDTADDSTFNNEDGSSGGLDQEDGPSDDPTDGEPVHGEDGDADTERDAGGSDEEQGDGEREVVAEGDSEYDQAEGDGSTESQDSPEASEDQSKEGDSSNAESAASDESADADGASPSRVGDGDVSGKPADPTGNSSPEDTDPGTHDTDSGADDNPEAEGSESGDGATDQVEDDESMEIDESMEVDDIWDEGHDGIDMTGIDAEHLGTAEEVALEIDGNDPHEHVEVAEAADDPESDSVEAEAMNLALQQSMYFDTSRVGVAGILEYQYPQPKMRWEYRSYGQRGIDSFLPDESTIGRALLKARKVFADNRKARHERSLKAGRIDPRVLGRRAALDDERLFRRRHIPAKKDYVVGITIDCSGSNHSGYRMDRAKRAAMAKAELLHRLGVKFYITAHTGGLPHWFDRGMDSEDFDRSQYLMLLWVKNLDEAWTDETRKKLAAIQPLAANFDGHTLEFHRKFLSDVKATDKILIYYTDGEMPASNYDEEVRILQHELKKCDQEGIVRLAVGINSSSPQDFGFDTVRVDSDDDLIKVVAQLERYLTR